MSTLPYLLLCECKTHQLAGRLRHALDAASHAEEIARLNGSDDHLSLALAAKAEAVLWIDGSTEPATQLAVRAAAAAGWRTGLAGREAVFVLAEITLATGDARRTTRQLVAASGGPALPAWPFTCRPKVFELLTRAALAVGDIDQARNWIGNEGFLIEEGHARTIAARAFTSANAEAAAAAELRRIRRIAQSCESTRLAGLADRHPNGIRPAWTAPPHPERDPYAPLSRREREVAALLATGMTNREIANQLYVTIRTVDTHVSRILRKLDVPSRAAVVGLQLSSGTPED
jgi:DNA-binding CsgD family transcriptional regulator